MPELTAKSFLSNLRYTEILSEQRIAEIEREFGIDCDPKTLALELVRTGELTSWQAKFLLSGREGLRIGNYILRERLSQDELGDRILAIHKSLDRPVDLQILPAEVNEESPAFQVFLRHVSKAAHLDHPNLIHVYDIDREGGRHYLVSEHFEAENLQQLFPVAINWYIVKIGSIARQLLGGIFHAHSENVVHGDIGPETILVSSNGTAKVDNLAIAALRRVIGDHRTAGRSPASPIPANDYRGCVKAMLQLLNAQTTPPTYEQQQLKAILEPLLQSSTERDAEAAILKLDGWLERNHAPQCEKEISLADFSAKASDETTFKAIENTTQKSPTIEPKDRPRKIPIGRIAALVSLAVLIGVLGFNWYRANRGPVQQTADVAPAASPGDQSPKSNSEAGKSKSEPSRLMTETAKRFGITDGYDENLPTDPGPDLSKPPLANTDLQVLEPAKKAEDAPAEAVAAVPSAQIPTESVVAEPVGKDAREAPQEAAEAAQASTEPQPSSISSDATPKEPTPKAATEAGNQAATPASSPFANTPRAVDLPEIMNSAEVTLGQVDPGSKFLLACSLITHDTVTRRTKFTLERASGDQSQVWTVVGDTSSGQPTPIAKISLVGTDLNFQWLDGIAPELTYSYLRNCLLSMQAGEATYKLCLRKPVKIGTAEITANEPQYKLTFELDSFPAESQTIVTEFLEISDIKLSQEDENFMFLVEPADQKFAERAPIFLFFTEKPDRYLFLEMNAKVAKKSEITTTIRIQQEPKPKLFSEKFAAEFDGYLKQIAAEVGQTYVAAKAYEAPYGLKRKHEAEVKRLAALLETSNQNVVDFGAQKRRATATFAKPIKFRAYYVLDEVEIDLATWDGEPHSAK